MAHASTSRKLAVALAVAGAGLMTAGAAQAGLVLDLRLADGGGKFKFVSQGQVVPLQLFGIVQGTDGIDNETLYNVFAVLRSSTGGLLGDFSPAVIQSPFNTGPYQSGLPFDVDSDGDLDLGRPFTPSTYLFARADPSLPSPQGTRIGLNDEEFLLAALSYTIGASSGASEVNAYRAPVAGLTEGADFIQDGIRGTGISSGIAVSLVIPEPSMLGVIGMCLPALRLCRRSCHFARVQRAEHWLAARVGCNSDSTHQGMGGTNAHRSINSGLIDSQTNADDFGAASHRWTSSLRAHTVQPLSQ